MIEGNLRISCMRSTDIAQKGSFEFYMRMAYCPELVDYSRRTHLESIQTSLSNQKEIFQSKQNKVSNMRLEKLQRYIRTIMLDATGHVNTYIGGLKLPTTKLDCNLVE